MNVLVIEDSEDMRFLMSEILPTTAPIGQLRCAANEADALKAVEGFRPHVVILDSCTDGPAPQHTADLMRALNAGVRVISFSGLPSIEGTWADVVIRKTHDGMTQLADALAGLAVELRTAS
ncbi:MAG: hypothetical protein ACRDKT_14075 [Actinomycetota bacterium]